MSFTARALFTAGAIATATLALGSGTVAAADLGAKDEPIKLALHEWTGQHITTQIAGHVLEKMGYKVEYVTAGYLGAGQAIADGQLAGSLEVWDNNLGDFYPKLISEGKLEDIGTVGIDAQEGWLYPVHVKEKCPGLPAWDAFKQCAQMFAVPETFPNGRFLDYPADWGDRGAQLVKSQNLAFTAVPAGSEGALVAELAASVETKSPLVMMFWAPHWALANYETEWVDIPTDVLDAGGMAKPRVFKLVWPGFKDKWPAAYAMLKAMKIDNAVQEPLMDLIDNKGNKAIDVTATWVNENEAAWKPWVDAAM